MFVFVLLFNILYKTTFDDEGMMLGVNEDNQKTYLEEELKKLDYQNINEVDDYVSTKTELDVINLLDKYDKNSWQKTIINDKMKEVIYNINYYTYNLEDEDKLNETKRLYNDYIDNFTNDNWQYYVKADLEETNNKLLELNNILQNTVSNQEKEVINKKIEEQKLYLTALNYRLAKNISYQDGYLNAALDSYTGFGKLLIDYDLHDNSHDNKYEYQTNKENFYLAKYTIETTNNINKYNDLRGGLFNLFEEYEIFIILIIVIVAGSIVSEEFNKGTIKLLLIKPYTRLEILLSKLIACFITILITIAILIIMELIVGGLMFGIDSLNIPIVIYNFNTDSVNTYNVFVYLLISFVAKLPFYLIIMLLAFASSAIFTNTSLAIILTLTMYLASSLIKSLALNYNVEFMKYFITLNWNLEQYLFGHIPKYQYINLNFSIIIYATYFIILLILPFIIFNKKNIKNI